jgi:hypothetical protein
MATKKVTGKEMKGEVSGNTIVLDGKEYEICLDLNVFAELEEIYGDPTKALDGLEKGSFKAIRDVLYAMLKTQNPKLTLIQVGKMINMNNIVEITNKINASVAGSLPEVDEEIKN